RVLVPCVLRQRLGAEREDVLRASDTAAERVVEGRAERVESGDDVAAVAADADRLLHDAAAEAPPACGAGDGDGGEPEHGERGAGDVLGEAIRLERADDAAVLLGDPGGFDAAVGDADLELPDPFGDRPVAREGMGPQLGQGSEITALRASHRHAPSSVVANDATAGKGGATPGVTLRSRVEEVRRNDGLGHGNDA